MWSCRPAPTRLAAALACLPGCGAAPGATCPESPLAEVAAADPTHVRVTFSCDVDAAAGSYTIADYARAPAEPLAVLGQGEVAARGIVLETAPQTAALYTLRARVRARDGAAHDASANFRGAGPARTAPVTFRVDDRYHARRAEVAAWVGVDAAGGWDESGTVLPLDDGDGDHVFEATLAIAVDPLRTVDPDDDRLGAARVGYAARAVTPAGAPLSALVRFAVPDAGPRAVDLPLDDVPDPPGPEGLADVAFHVDDGAARALVEPTLRAGFSADGAPDPTFPTTLPLADADGDHVWRADARVRIAPGTGYAVYLADASGEHPAVQATFAVPDERPVRVDLRVGDPALVPVTFRVDVSRAYLDPAGRARGVHAGEAVFLTGEFATAQDAFFDNAADAFSGGENPVLRMRERAGAPGVWERTLFLGPGRPYGWKVVRCPAATGCGPLNARVTSSGRAFATVAKNLVPENRDADAHPEVRPIDPRDPGRHADARVYVGQGRGAEPDPDGTPRADLLFKQETPDLVVQVGDAPLATPVYVIGTWRDVNIPATVAEIIAGDAVLDLNPYDYDDGLIGVHPPSYPMAEPPPPAPFALDGALDAGAARVAGAATTMTLWAAWDPPWLYVATEDAGEGSDHFLFVAVEPPGPVAPAPWGKAGTVALPPGTLVLADENDNGFSGWFDLASGALLEAAGTDGDPTLAAAAGAGGGVLEGVLDLSARFPAGLATVYLAAGPWHGDDGGALYPDAQVPATGDGDGDLDAAEVLAWPLP